VNQAGYLAGPPELIVEVAASSASIDLRDKRRAYYRNGLREYLVWLVAEARLEWFCLDRAAWSPLPAGFFRMRAALPGTLAWHSPIRVSARAGESHLCVVSITRTLPHSTHETRI